MRRLALLVILVAAVGAIAIAAQMDDQPAATGSAKPADAPKLPANRHDPEDRKAAVDNSASTGASAARLPAPKDGAPARGTDLGKEADKEDDAFRKGRSEKP